MTETEAARRTIYNIDSGYINIPSVVRNKNDGITRLVSRHDTSPNGYVLTETEFNYFDQQNLILEKGIYYNLWKSQSA
ncbi:hypothetical protein [Belnapia rosea]|uniref:hypothetical protein n=1 Tax=Belnapia rosea TaxID=938405 RepID=UPI000883282B|nr:hypothetical protein [Belnapia rosea]SDB66502.1 hypothetical protein SAMN02927895_02932 [Belnapia rosea]